MKYRVVIGRLAQADLDAAYRWAAHHAPYTAARWLRRFQEALRTLETRPLRCGRAPEGRKVARDLRQFLVGRKPDVFRAIWIQDGETVRVLRIVRTQRQFLTRRQIDEAIEPDDLDA